MILNNKMKKYVIEFLAFGAHTLELNLLRLLEFTILIRNHEILLHDLAQVRPNVQKFQFVSKLQI